MGTMSIPNGVAARIAPFVSPLSASGPRRHPVDLFSAGRPAAGNTLSQNRRGGTAPWWIPSNVPRPTAEANAQAFRTASTHPSAEEVNEQNAPSVLHYCYIYY